MTILSAVTIALSVSYGALILLYRAGWRRERAASRGPRKQSSAAQFCIVIPARNEAANIGPLLDSIFSQRYSANAFEVLVVDDHSTDETAAIAETYAQPNLKVLRLSQHLYPDDTLNSAKKRALALGILHARHPLIVTTDADCIVPPDWLACLGGAFSDDAVLVAAPVDFSKGRGVLYLFQSLDFMAMQGITAAAQAMRLGTMSNGANLAFTRIAFEDVDGYNGIDHLASGDDYLLTRKLATHFGHARLRYVLEADAIVRTAAQPSWSSFLQQRIRWASKSGKYNDPRLTAILVLVYAMNVWLLALAVMALFGTVAGRLLFASLLVKIVLEIFFLWSVAGFFGKRRELLAFPFLQPLHILYIVLAGFLGMRGGYRWKGRDVR